MTNVRVVETNREVRLGPEHLDKVFVFFALRKNALQHDVTWNSHGLGFTREIDLGHTTTCDATQNLKRAELCERGVGGECDDCTDASVDRRGLPFEVEAVTEVGHRTEDNATTMLSASVVIRLSVRIWCLVVVVASPLLACGGDDSADGCASPADCASNEVCINGTCMPASTDAGGDDAHDATTDVGEEDALPVDAPMDDAGEDVGLDAAVDVVPDTFDAGPLTCPGPGGADDEPIVLYTFAASDTGAMIQDRAPAAPDVPLTVNTGDFTLSPMMGGSITFTAGQTAATQAASDALTTAILDSGSFTVEVWFTEVDLDVEESIGPERIVTLSFDSGDRFFTIGQNFDELVVRPRTTTTVQNGTECDEPRVGDAARPRAAIVEPDVMDLSGTPKHVVLSFDSAEGRPRVYLNGVEVAEDWPCRTGALGWVTGTHIFALGDETNSIRNWEGTLHRVTVYNRAMSAAEVSCWAGAGHTADVFR